LRKHASIRNIGSLFRDLIRFTRAVAISRHPRSVRTCILTGIDPKGAAITATPEVDALQVG